MLAGDKKLAAGTQTRRRWPTDRGRQPWPLGVEPLLTDTCQARPGHPAVVAAALHSFCDRCHACECVDWRRMTSVNANCWHVVSYWSVCGPTADTQLSSVRLGTTCLFSRTGARAASTNANRLSLRQPSVMYASLPPAVVCHLDNNMLPSTPHCVLYA